MKICDRCKKDKDVNTIQFFGDPKLWRFNYLYGASKQSIDLCDNCIDDFWQWIKGNEIIEADSND